MDAGLRVAQRGKGAGRLAWRSLVVLAVVAATLAVEGATTHPATAATTYTVVNEQFNETPPPTPAFPPANWTATSSDLAVPSNPAATWAPDCATTSPVTGCFAKATLTATGDVESFLVFNPPSPIPTNLQNLTLSFYSDFTSNAPAGDINSTDTATVYQGVHNTENQHQLVSIQGGAGSDPTGTPVLHTIALTSTLMPLTFDWRSFGNAATNPLKTWGITDVVISGTLPTTTYTLTANPVPNTTYPHVLGGTTLTIALSGSSNPSGDSLIFGVNTAPTYGTLGAFTSTDATDATVTDTLPPCADPTGQPQFTCESIFKFTVSDAAGAVSSSAQVTIDVIPEGAGSQTVTVTAPAAVGYQTLGQTVNGQTQLVPGAIVPITIGPSDFPDEAQVDLQVASGSINLHNAVASGATFLNGTSNGGTQIDLAGSVQVLNQALDSATYFPPSGTTPTTNFNIFTTDLGPRGAGPFTQGASATVVIQAAAPPPPSPVLHLPPGSQTTANNVGPLSFTPSISLTDAGATATTVDSVNLSVSGGTLDLPSADTSGSTQIVTVTSSAIGQLDISGTVAHLNQALGDLTFDPTGLPTETVTVTASSSDPDTQTASIPSSFDIKVSEAPFAFGASSISTLENLPATIFLCADGASGDQLSFTSFVEPVHGTLVANSASTAGSGCSQNATIAGFTYTPANGYIGADSFSYVVHDATNGLSSVTNQVTITVTAPAKPTAENLSASTEEDTPVDITLCGVNPAPSTTLNFVITFSPPSGTLVKKGTPALNPCAIGTDAVVYTYTPNPGTFTQDGIDSFQYMVNNGTPSDVATVTIMVATKTPQVLGATLSVPENGTLGLELCGTDPNGLVTFTLTGPFHGTLDQMSSTNQVNVCPPGFFAQQYERYVPNQLYVGSDTIGFTVTSGGYTSRGAAINISVTHIEIPPVAHAQTVTDIAPKSVPITLSASLVQGSSPLTYRVVTFPGSGTLTGMAPNLVYTPSIGSGTVTFTFVANDGVADSLPATVTINIVTPRLASSVCKATTPVSPDLEQFNCASGSLPIVPDGKGGHIPEVNTSGARNAQTTVQTTITNETSVPDTVTITATNATSPWNVRYDVQGADQTDALLGAGVQVTLGPAGSPTASTYVQAVVFSPLNFPAPPTQQLTVTAVSGNLASVSTSAPVEMVDGTSSPSLTLTQADGTGAVSFPTSLIVTPILFGGGPAGQAIIHLGITGTGDNIFKIQSQTNVGTAPGITVKYLFQGVTDITAAVEAGTETIECYADIGCPYITAVLTPGSGSGFFSAVVTETSVIDGQQSAGFFGARLAGSVGPNLYADLPNLGIGVFEPTPVTKIRAHSVQVGGSASQTVFLINTGDVPDTITVKDAVTLATGDLSAIAVSATPGGNLGTMSGASSDVTSSLLSGTYQVTLNSGDGVIFTVTDAAGTTAGLAAPSVVLTATSKLDPAKVDSFEVTFPSYTYRPDAVLTGVNGQPIGANVYGGLTQTDEWNVNLTPTTIKVSFYDRGTGPWPSRDAVVVTSPTSDPNFALTYSLSDGGTSTDVTSAITGAGLDLNLGQSGSPTPVLTITAQSTPTAQPGHPGYFPITVTSRSSIPSGLSDTVTVGLYNTGSSQLRFDGMPQAEPGDITSDISGYPRVAPFAPDTNYTPGVTYGDYSDPTGQKFVYASAYDTFNLQVSSQNVSHTVYRLQMVDPGTGSGLPAWERVAFATPYFNGRALDTPLDPMGSSGLNPVITANGTNVTAAVEGGTFSTAALGTYETSYVTVSFNPSANGGQRYTPLKFNLINNATGAIEDVLVIDVTNIITCSADGAGQHLVTIKGASGQRESLSFRSFDRLQDAPQVECMQHLSHSWISQLPVVFSSYEPGINGDLAGGYNPEGFWLVPQGGVVRIDTDTLDVTSSYAKSYVDSPMLGADGLPDPNATIENYYFVGNFPNLDWHTTDGTNGIAVTNSLIPASPFPLIAPDQSNWPNNTMAADRYFQVDTATGYPVMIGEMEVNTPWYHNNVSFVMPVDNTTGLTLDYSPPSNPTVSLPGNSSVTSDGIFWTTTTNGVVVQGGCLGLPPAAANLLGLNFSDCYLEVTTTYDPIPADPSQQAKIAQITVALKPLKVVLGTQTFNLKTLTGFINFDPSTGAFQKLVMNGNFNVGPITPCQAEKLANAAAKVETTTAQKITGAACPTNYFTFDAQITVQQGGFTSTTTGYGVQFIGTLSFLGYITLTQVEADVQTSPFNFHFANSPIDVSVDIGIPLAARITLSGDVGALGFDIGLSGSISVDNQAIASASGVFSTKGFGLCGGLAGVSVGFGDVWGDSPVFYGSGCTTDQFQVAT